MKNIVIYVCDRCGKERERKSNHEKHLNRKFKCSVKIKEEYKIDDKYGEKKMTAIMLKH
jgi:DNA-directed RNA polymerase subunit RPC12/RpoP